MAKRREPVITWTGAAIAIAGIALIAVQMYGANETQMRTLQWRGPWSTEASLTTSYIGAILVLIGAFLLTVGYLGSRPWSTGRRKQGGPRQKDPSK